MVFDLTAEQRDMQKLCREFAEEEIKPYVKENRNLEWEGSQDERFPAEVWELAHEIGLHLLNVPREYGGEELDPGVLTQALMLEELATGDHSIANGISTNWKLATLLRQFPKRLQDEWFPKMVDDPYFAMAHALTEPKGASDRWLPYNEPEGNMNTTAEKDGDEWVINGTKQFITNGWEADIIFVYANSSPDEGMLDGTSGPFLVPTETDGVEINRVNETMGHRFDSNAEMYFNDVRVPKDHLLIEDTALRDVGQYFTGGRVKIAARILGTGRRAFEMALEYAQDRVQGGKPIVEHQMVQNRIAEMSTNLETARSTIWRAAASADAGRDNANRLGIVARLHAADAVLDIAEDAVEIHGGAGSMRAQGIEKLMRDAVVNMHLHGTQDIHKIKLVNELTGKGDPGTHA